MIPDPFPARLRNAVRAEAESYRRRNATPVFARLSVGPNQALVSRVLKAGDDDPVWTEFASRLQVEYGTLAKAMNELQLRTAVLRVWPEVEVENHD